MTQWLITVLIGFKHLSPLCLRILCHEKKISKYIQSFSIPIMYFQSHHDGFSRRFRKIVFMAVIMDPYVIFSALYFKHSQSNWILKFIELTKCLQNCRFYRTIISDYSSKVKKIQLKLYNSEDFSAHDLHWEHGIFWDCAAWSYHCCLLYTSDAADDMQCVDLGGRRIIKKIRMWWVLRQAPYILNTLDQNEY